MSGRRPIVLVAALAFALSACSSTADVPPPGTAPTSVPAPTSTSAPARKNIAYTKPGTKLEIGEKAVVPFTTGSSPVGAVGITATRIDRGTEAEVAQLNLGDDLPGLVPFYVQVTVSNETGDDFSAARVIGIRGLLKDGSKGRIGLSADSPKCHSDATGDFTAKGATYGTCTMELAVPGATVTGAKYDDDGYAWLAKGTDYQANPIGWQPRSRLRRSS
ncbi:hypothetical protein G3I59_29740 [Amycolatopsis rubida]|uniref:Lipoprotein n=1 Tax=Amycolatopsis rubida TaxID=112413 RepID=A0ABX0C3R0_9PSEU|nr:MULTISPECIES: hypothetical protein [Amycolatopsis]MYW94662.1 hypothetical protein [Amycolatopsis rubida]NEC59650.1 hypothetical protein [Amycolatopsis rubida]OAP27629.1 hypothetical protein A4R44_01234 [Amycolatopsis sp. M39]